MLYTDGNWLKHFQNLMSQPRQSMPVCWMICMGMTYDVAHFIVLYMEQTSKYTVTSDMCLSAYALHMKLI